MSRASVLAAGRRAAEAGMVDTCTITRPATTSTDPDTGVVTTTTTEVYAGRCRVQQGTAGQGNRVDAGETSVIVLSLEVQLPISVGGLEEGDEVLITDAVNDLDLVGRRFAVHDLAHKTEATARRVKVTEVT